MRTLRPYQKQAIESVRRVLERNASAIVVLPTGTGKTSVASTLMNEWPGGNCLFLAHTRELVDQAAGRLEGELGYPPVIEMGIRGGDEGLFYQGGMVVIGSVQSMLTDRRLAKYERNPFDLIVIDECVTGDTLINTDVGEIRIDSLPTSHASCVMTYNGEAVCYRPITAFMPKGVRPVLRIETASGRIIRCTGNHPLYTARGWVNASAVRESDSLLCAGAGAASRPELTSGADPAVATPAAPSGERSLPTSPTACTTSFDPVVSVRSDGDESVYDITVDDTHCFFANGILAHNCHRATSRSYRKIVEYFVGKNATCKTVGLTATPNRADGTALGLVFEQVAYAMDIPDAIDNGWLVQIRERAIVVSDVEITGPNKTNELGEKDFTDSAVESVMIDERALRATAQPLVEQAAGRPTLVFCASVRHAHELAAMIDSYAPGAAAAVDGETPIEQRLTLIKQFKSGEIQFLCNAQLFIEGFDSPNCACVAIARPTKSVGRYTQMIGRGLRPLPGIVDNPGDSTDRKLWIATSDKPDALILDFVNAGAVGLVTIDDILGGNYDVETRQLAATDREANDTSVKSSLERAKFLLALEREMDARSKNQSAVDYEVFDRDGRAVATAPGASTKTRGTITDGQLGFLISLGCEPDHATCMSQRQAAAVINSMRESHCTTKQRQVLGRAGIDATGIGFERASRIIDALKANNWRRPEVLPE